MRPLYTLAVALLLSFSANAQYFFLTNFSGTTFYGTYGVTVTSVGSVSTGGGICFTAPTEYWAGQTGPGGYIYTVNKPVYRIRVHTWGINGGPLGAGEYCTMYINGTVYPLTPANVLSYTECSPGGGPMYLNLGNWMGPVGTTGNYNGGDYFIAGTQTSSCAAFTSFELWCNGSLSGVAYHIEMDTVRPLSCVQALNNSPCIGDTLFLDDQGDSTGATYLWTGPGGFTSTLQRPFIFPSTFADSGNYICYRFSGLINDTDTTHVEIHPLPVVTAGNNSPLCLGLGGTLQLNVNLDSAGETFIWSGPPAGSFSSTLQNPTRPGFANVDTGIYHVYATTRWGCKDTGQTHVTAIQQPATPIVSDENYCQGETFVPYTLGSIVPGDTVLYYGTASGGIGSTTPLIPTTSIPGMYYVWVTQKLGACESNRGEDSVRVVTTPPAPGVTGIFDYCQYVGTVTPLSVTTTISGTARWYGNVTGGSPIVPEPYADITNPIAYHWWVSQVDSGCESLRTPVTVTVHPKPAKPTINPTSICQYSAPAQLSANLTEAGDGYQWYGPGVTPPMSSAPILTTNVAPDTVKYYVTETSSFGCVSDSAIDVAVVKVKPIMPVTTDIRYCQHAHAAPLNALVDSIGNSHLNWYYNAVSRNPTPVPFTDTIPGIYTWYVSQTVPNDITGCESDSAAVNVTIIYKPVFDITSASPSVCQYDTLWLAYNALGQSLVAPNYLWTLPSGAAVVGGTHLYDSLIRVKFDTANQNNYVHLRASDDSGFCFSDTSVYIKVIGHPNMSAFTQGDVCLNDTVQLALSDIANGASAFTWYIDNIALNNSTAIKMIVANSNSSGPYLISWIDTGMHVIKVTSVTVEGCKSPIGLDSVNVHPAPNAGFIVEKIDSASQFCLEDSVLFLAAAQSYNYSYLWTPEHAFNNVNKREIWGKLESTNSVITLKVTDPYGCYATSSQSFEPGTCCTVVMPNAFTPGSATINRTYGPVYSGYHNFHSFNIKNRWGVTVFNGGNTDVRWDGTYNGAPQDMGVYYYYLKYDCGGRTIEVKGDVTLIR